VLVTLVHEAGHIVVAAVTGRRIDHFQVFGPGQRVAYSAKRGRGPSRIRGSAAGYTAPPLVGLGGATFLTTGLADRLGVARQTVNALEIGRYDPSLPLASKTPRCSSSPSNGCFFRMTILPSSHEWGVRTNTDVRDLLGAATRRRPLRSCRVALSVWLGPRADDQVAILL
jgi:DNA-binding XRE family transcriptional regulator